MREFVLNRPFGPSRWRNLHPNMRWAVLLWAVLVIGVTLRAAFAPVGSNSVFPVYSTAAQHWSSGENLYDFDFSQPHYRYHPAIAVSFVPATLLPEKLAAILWRWIGVGLLLAGLNAWLKYLAPVASTPAKRGLLLALVTPFALQSVNNAQANVHVIGLLLLGLVAAARDRWLWSALLIAVATLFKMYPAAIGLLMVAIYPRPFALRYLLMVLAGSVLPFLAQQPDYVVEQYRLWFESLMRDRRYDAPISGAYRDLSMVFRVCEVPFPEKTYHIVQACSGLAFAFLCLKLKQRGASRQLLLATILHLGCLWMTLLGPSTESSTYTLLGPTAALLLVISPAERSRPFRAVLGFGYALLIFRTVSMAFPIERTSILLALQPLGALLILFVLIVEITSRLRLRVGQTLSKPSAAESTRELPPRMPAVLAKADA